MTEIPVFSVRQRAAAVPVKGLSPVKTVGFHDRMEYNARTWSGIFPVPFSVRSGYRHPETVLLFRDVYAVQVFPDILRRYYDF